MFRLHVQVAILKLLSHVGYCLFCHDIHLIYSFSTKTSEICLGLDWHRKSDIDVWYRKRPQIFASEHALNSDIYLVGGSDYKYTLLYTNAAIYAILTNCTDYPFSNKHNQRQSTPECKNDKCRHHIIQWKSDHIFFFANSAFFKDIEMACAIFENVPNPVCSNNIILE